MMVHFEYEMDLPEVAKSSIWASRPMDSLGSNHASILIILRTRISLSIQMVDESVSALRQLHLSELLSMS
jgi:hypothetical protein